VSKIASLPEKEGTPMLAPIKTTVLLAATIAWLPAQAEYLGLGIKTNIELTTQDLDMIHHTVDTRVHGRPVGTTASWKNPDSENSGKIKLAKKYVRNGQQCETIEYTLRTTRQPVRPEHYMLNSCLQPDGQWRLI
jgi:surface antigen